MPIYEYHCRDCGLHFEKLVRSMSSAVEVECPQCHSKNCEKSISLFGVASNGNGAATSAASCSPSG